ncbi:reverse transcriptase domain protein [Colletotrichum musicola]|uniref:Reverse transcriptase domain protein n=1 Tax=Colletotrichum musicola TaxID=2175873 RepID=A0A8H6N4U2_9PEZI|nr:reverse transcriptase domain protein [Colletotrichum musicola]
MGSLERYFKGLITNYQGFQAFLHITDFFQKIYPQY